MLGFAALNRNLRVVRRFELVGWVEPYNGEAQQRWCGDGEQPGCAVSKMLETHP